MGAKNSYEYKASKQAQLRAEEMAGVENSCDQVPHELVGMHITSVNEHEPAGAPDDHVVGGIDPEVGEFSRSSCNIALDSVFMRET